MTDATARPAKRRRKPITGIIDPNRVRKGLFALSSACVGACVVISILAIWDYVGNQAAFKSLASCAVLVAGGGLFEILNRTFGKSVEDRPNPFKPNQPA